MCLFGECIKRMNPGEISNAADSQRFTMRTADCLCGWWGETNEIRFIHIGPLHHHKKSQMLPRQTWRTMLHRDNSVTGVVVR